MKKELKVLFWTLFIAAILVWLLGSCSKRTVYNQKFMVSFATHTSFRAFVFVYGDEELNPTLGIMYAIYNGEYLGKFYKTDSTWTIENAKGETRSFDPYLEIPQMKLFKKKRPKEEKWKNYRHIFTRDEAKSQLMFSVLSVETPTM